MHASSPQPVTLEGAHVRLEPLTLGHLAALQEIAFDPGLWRWTGSRIENEDDLRRYVEEALELQAKGSALPFATMLRDSGKVVGSTRFANIEPQHRKLEIGWTWIARPWQRSAVNTEAKYLMLRHAFEALDCIRVELKTDALNQRSRNAIVRIGAKQEGILRRHMVAHGGRVRDTVYFSIIREEWPAVKTELERKMQRET